MRKSLKLLALCFLVLSCLAGAGCGRHRSNAATVSDAPVTADAAGAKTDAAAAGQGGAAQPAPTPRATPAPVEELPVAEDTPVATARVHFDLGKDFLKAREQKLIDAAMKNVSPAKVRLVRVEGHCCEIGSVEWNEALGQRRAEAVQGYMEKAFGLRAPKFTLESFGKRQPIASNSTEKGRRQNRRAELSVYY